MQMLSAFTAFIVKGIHLQTAEFAHKNASQVDN